MPRDPKDYPALTYGNVRDVSAELAGVPAVPVFTMGLEELEFLLPALERIVEVGRAERDIAAVAGYPLTHKARTTYPNVGVYVVLNGPEEMQVITVSARRLKAIDLDLDSYLEEYGVGADEADADALTYATGLDEEEAAGSYGGTA